MTRRPVTLVVSALRGELAPLATELGLTPPAEAEGSVSAGGALSLAVTGSGARAAGLGLSALLATGGFDRVLGIGVAGALTGELEVGDLVRATKVRTRREVVWSSGEAGPASRADTGAGEPRCGVVVSVDTILSSAAAKRGLAGEIGAEAPTVVDLESSAWAAAAAQAAVPIEIVRAVSDRLDEDLPLDFERFRDRSGRLVTGRVIRHVLPRPGLWGPLARLRRRLCLCAERLAETVVRDLKR